MSRRLIEDMESVPEMCKKHQCNMYWRGDWFCPKCQQEEEWMDQDNLAERKGICLRCIHSVELESFDCNYYGFPQFKGRKKKCKGFKEDNGSYDGYD